MDTFTHFTLYATAGTVTAAEGAPATFNVNETALYGYNGRVTLSAPSLPTGFTASFNPTATTVGNLGTATFAIADSVPTGTYPITIVGTDANNLTHSIIVCVVVTPIEFSMSATPSSLTLDAASSVPTTVIVSGLNGYSDTIDLTPAGLPAATSLTTAVTAAFSQNPIAGSGTSTLTLSTTGNVLSGVYTIYAVGTDQSDGSVIAVPITLTLVGAVDYTVSAASNNTSDAPGHISVTAGSTATATVTIAGINNLSDNVALSVTGLPSFVTPSWSTNPVAGSGTSTLTLTASSSSTPWTGTISIIAADTTSGLSHTATLTLTVVAPDFAISANPNPVNVDPGNYYQPTISVASVDGYSSSSIGLTLIDDPVNPILGTGTSQISASVISSPIAVGGTSMINMYVGATVQGGTYNLSIQGVDNNNNNLTHTVPLTVNVQPHIADLEVSPKAVYAGGTATVTVTIDGPAPAGGVTIPITYSSDGATSGQATCPIAAGATSGTFTVTGNTVAEVTQSTITGWYGTGWLQSAYVAVMPTDQQLQVTNVSACPGNGCVFVSWNELPDGSISGYNVYRTDSTDNTVLLNSTPLPQPDYADNSVTNGQTYSYTVCSVSLAGAAGQTVSSGNVTPSSDISTVQWVDPPSVATGQSTVYTNSSLPGFVLIDGNSIVGASMADSGCPGSCGAVLNSQQWPNGWHTLQFICCADGVANVSSQIQIEFNNVVTCTSEQNAYFEPPSFETVSVGAQIPSGSASTISIVSDDTDDIVRSWSQVSSSVSVAWDGTDMNGNALPDGSYSIYLDSQGSHVEIGRAAMSMLPPPQILVFVGESNIWTRPTDRELENHIRRNLAYEFDPAMYSPLRDAYWGESFRVLSSSILDYMVGSGRTTFVKSKLIPWLEISVQDFVFTGGHGVTPIEENGGPRDIVWGWQSQAGISINSNGVVFCPWPVANVRSFDSGRPNEIFVPDHVLPNQMHFVWLDCCWSGGGDESSFDESLAHDNWDCNVPPGTDWAAGFRLGGNGVLMSNVGLNDTNMEPGTYSTELQQPSETPSYWWCWREQMWNYLASASGSDSPDYAYYNSCMKTYAFQWADMWPFDESPESTGVFKVMISGNGDSAALP